MPITINSNAHQDFKENWANLPTRFDKTALISHGTDTHQNTAHCSFYDTPQDLCLEWEFFG